MTNVDPQNALAVQAIHDEADQTPGADMKKIKKKCKKWLNKKEGEVGRSVERTYLALRMRGDRDSGMGRSYFWIQESLVLPPACTVGERRSVRHEPLSLSFLWSPARAEFSGSVSFGVE